MQNPTLNAANFQRRHASDDVLPTLFGHLEQLGQTSGWMLRYAMLSVLAILLLSKPISFREVTHAGKDSAPRA